MSQDKQNSRENRINSGNHQNLVGVRHDKRNNDTHTYQGQSGNSRHAAVTQEISRQPVSQKPKASDTNTNHGCDLAKHNTARLSEIFRDVPTLYMESQQTNNHAKKTACYYKIAGLNSEAKNIISNLETSLCDMNTNISVNSNDKDVDILLDLVSTQDLNFQELMHAIEKFSSVLNGLPSKPNVKTDIESEMIYEEEEIASDEL